MRYFQNVLQIMVTIAGEECSLIHFMSLVSFYTPWKQKTRDFLMFSGGMEKSCGIKWFDVLTTYCISDHTYLITLQIVANRKADNNYIPYSIKNLTSSSSHSFGTENDSIKSAPHTSFTSTRIEISKNQLTVVFNRNSAMPCVCS